MTAPAMEAQCPLLSLLQRFPDILGPWPLRLLGVLSVTCKTLRTAVQQTPEHAWLARAQHYPAWHPLLQAPSARAFFAQQAHAHDNLQHGRIAEQEVTQQWATVSQAAADAAAFLSSAAPLTSARAQVGPDCDKVARRVRTSAGHQLLIGSLLAPDTPWREVPLPPNVVLDPCHLWQWNRSGSALCVPYCLSVLSTDSTGNILSHSELRGNLIVDATTCVSHQVHESPSMQQGDEAGQWHGAVGWSPADQLLVVREIQTERYTEFWFTLHSVGGDVVQAFQGTDVAAMAALDSAPLPEQAWAPNGRQLICHGGGLACTFLCDFTAETARLATGDSIPWYECPCPAWEPSSDRLLLCSEGCDVALRHSNGRVSLQRLAYSVKGGAVWTARGIAVCGTSTLCVCACAPGSDSLQVQRVLVLQPDSTFFKHPATLNSLRGALAVSWDASHLAVIVAQKGAAGEPEAMALAFVSRDRGLLPLHALSISRMVTFHDGWHTNVRWSSDSTALCLAELSHGPSSMVFRLA